MLKWYPCEMHCHTLNSDGDFTVTELLTSAKNYGLYGIALTDHNTMAGHRAVTDELQDKTVKVLKGIEWTTYFGHMLVTDCQHFVDWRDAVPDNIDEKTDEIKKHGGMIGVAHPFELGSPMCTGGFWEYNVHKWENFDYIEVWSKPFPASKSANERAMMMWSNLLDRGYHLSATYGKDWHRPMVEDVPSGCTYIGTDSKSFSGMEMKKAVLCGRTSVTMGPLLTLTAQQCGNTFNQGDTIKSGDETVFTLTVDENTRKEFWEKFSIEIKMLRLVGKGSKVLAEAEHKKQPCQFRLNASDGWYRAEMWGIAAGLECEIGFTSPIYCE